MMIAPGALALAMPTPKNVNASRMPRPGPGFASMRNRIDLPVSSDCWMPSGVNTPWLIALLRKRILPGSTRIDTQRQQAGERRASSRLPRARC